MGLFAALAYLGVKKMRRKKGEKRLINDMALTHNENMRKPEFIIPKKIDVLLKKYNDVIDAESQLYAKLEDDEVLKEVQIGYYHNHQEFSHDDWWYDVNQYYKRPTKPEYHASEFRRRLCMTIICETVINHGKRPVQTFAYAKYIPLLKGDWNVFRKIKMPERRRPDGISMIKE